MLTDVLGRERYLVDRPLGVGDMGTVQLARDTVLGRVVAIKVLAGHLAADDAFRLRFLREARLAARLCHPNIVQVFDAGEDGGCPFLVMEYVEGETVAGGRGFPAAELIGLATQLAAALAHAHARGVVHRDVKPHNVVLRPDGVAKLTDFGIARAVEERGLTEIGTVLGTAPFMAPEQAAGRSAGPAADMYALGALVRHCAAGPLPADVAAVVDGLLADDPAARPPAAEVHRRLLALARAPATGPAAEPRPGPTAPADSIPTVVAPPEPEPAPTVLRALPGTAFLPPPVRSWIDGRGRTWAAPLAAAAVLLVLFVLTAPLRSTGGQPATGPSTTAPSTTAPAAAATAGVTPVPPAADPAQAARNLADWLRSQARWPPHRNRDESAADIKKPSGRL